MILLDDNMITEMGGIVVISVTLRQFGHYRSLYAPTNLLLFFCLRLSLASVIIYSLGFPSFHFVPSVGKSGGLLLM